MKRPPQTPLSLRARLVLWQLVVLTPRFTEPLRKIAEAIANEVLRVKHLQLTLHAAGATPSTRLYI